MGQEVTFNALLSGRRRQHACCGRTTPCGCTGAAYPRRSQRSTSGPRPCGGKNRLKWQHGRSSMGASQEGPQRSAGNVSSRPGHHAGVLAKHSGIRVLYSSAVTTNLAVPRNARSICGVCVRSGIFLRLYEQRISKKRLSIGAVFTFGSGSSLPIATILVLTVSRREGTTP